MNTDNTDQIRSEETKSRRHCAAAPCFTIISLPSLICVFCVHLWPVLMVGPELDAVEQGPEHVRVPLLRLAGLAGLDVADRPAEFVRPRRAAQRGEVQRFDPLRRGE